MNHIFNESQIKTEPIQIYLGTSGDLSHSTNKDFGTNAVPHVYVNQVKDIDNSARTQCDIKDESDLNNEDGQCGTTAKMQSCKICGKVLSSSSSYYVHMKLHSGNKPFQCSMCEAAFCRKPYLEVHMRVHTGERPYQCEYCQKRFTQKSSLNTHKRVHTGERPYACDICNKRFAVKSYVIAHRWSHVSDRPISCDQCQLNFTSKPAYALHLRSHNTDKSFDCTVCGRTFVKDSYLIRHHYRTHSQSPFSPPSSNSSHLQTIIRSKK